MELVVATTNLHKVRELRSMLRSLPDFDVYSLRDFPDYVQPPEDGVTFSENAEIKASHAAKTLNRWVVADDSGLVVPALNSDPGVYSARYAGVGASDQDNRRKLLKEMQNLSGRQRDGYFECSMCLAGPDGSLKTMSGRCEGTILSEERGGNGFGYDSLFLKHDYNKTMAELTEDVKNTISHRFSAFQKLLPELERLSAQQSS